MIRVLGVERVVHSKMLPFKKEPMITDRESNISEVEKTSTSKGLA
jgi:hypothetical protein